uniref:ShKT domain-containing protein n=1 Tax=Panagrolaimus sp. PS1159 TaxID=55785 RepID=A0AC35FKY1_9BILA
MKLLFLFSILFLIIVTVFGGPLNSEEEEECVDKSEYCKHIKNNCFDTKYEKLMKTQCRATCGFCGVKPDFELI